MTTKDLANLVEFNAKVDRWMCNELFGETGDEVWRWIATYGLAHAIGNMDLRQRRILAEAINAEGKNDV